MLNLLVAIRTGVQRWKEYIDTVGLCIYRHRYTIRFLWNKPSSNKPLSPLLICEMTVFPNFRNTPQTGTNLHTSHLHKLQHMNRAVFLRQGIHSGERGGGWPLSDWPRIPKARSKDWTSAFHQPTNQPWTDKPFKKSKSGKTSNSAAVWLHLRWGALKRCSSFTLRECSEFQKNKRDCLKMIICISKHIKHRFHDFIAHCCIPTINQTTQKKKTTTSPSVPPDLNCLMQCNLGQLESLVAFGWVRIYYTPEN